MIRHLAVYAPVIDPRPAGLGVYTEQVCRRLSQGVGCTTLYTETADTTALDWARLHVHTIPSLPRLQGPERLVLRQLWLQGVLPQLLRRSGADALFVPFHDGCLFPSVPQFIVVHDLTPLRVPSPYYHRLAANHLRHILPVLVRRSAGVIAVSENTRLDLDALLGVSPRNVSVVSEGYDRRVFRPHSEAEIAEVLSRVCVSQPFLLYAGTYAAHKNAELTAKVFADLAGEFPGLSLVLCGRPDAGDFEAIKTIIAERGLEGRTRTLGYVAGEDLSTLMSAATAFLYPSLYEGFGLAPLEAMASGAVVIASTSASVPEVVGAGGILLPPRDTSAWTASVRRLLRDPMEAARMRASAIERAASFDWDATARDILELIATKAVVGRRRSSDDLR